MARGERAATCACALMLGLLPPACAPKQGGPAVAAPSAEAAAAQVLADRPAAEQLFAGFVSAHNARVARLETLESRASLELRYSDSDGDHFDQCEADVFLASGGRGALRATKVGNNLLWVGSDGRQGWIFRLDKEPTTLVVFEDLASYAPGQRAGADGAAEFGLLAPSSVRTLAALAPIPEKSKVVPIADAAADRPLAERFELVFESSFGRRAAMRFGADGLPSSVRLLGAGGGTLLSAELAEYTAAQAENLAQGAWPKVPRKVVVTMPGGDAGRKPAEARIYLDAPIAMAKRMKPRFFVLDELVAQLRPDSVEHVVASEGGDGGQ